MRHCWTNTRNVLQVEEVAELCQVLLSNRGKVVDFHRSRSSVSEAGQWVEQTRHLLGYDSLGADQEVARILLLSYVKVEDLAEDHTDLFLKGQLEPCRPSEMNMCELDEGSPKTCRFSEDLCCWSCDASSPPTDFEPSPFKDLKRPMVLPARFQD